jgi:Flp pilus assembly protein TadD
MAKIWELLDQAYDNIRKDQYTDAKNVLDKILRTDPQNVEAWDAYISICKTRHDLEGLRNHIVKVWETRVRDHDYLYATQRFVLQRLDDKLENL